MIREMKVTVMKYFEKACEVRVSTRDEGCKKWSAQGIIPQLGTVSEVMKDEFERMTKWNWIPYDVTENDTMTFWKEL